MRDYLSESNLVKAAGLAVVLTVMSLGRLIEARQPLGLYIPATFVAMTLIAGAVTAWGQRAGMPGIVTDRRTFLRGAAVAAGLSLLALPLYLFVLDPLLKTALLTSRHRTIVELSYPSTWEGRLSLVLWSAGFQALFLQAAPMSLFARLTGRRSAAVGLCLALRAYVSYRQVASAGVADGVPLLFVSALVTTAAGCVVFARFGLAPAMLFAAGLDLHVFFAGAGSR